MKKRKKKPKFSKKYLLTHGGLRGLELGHVASLLLDRPAQPLPTDRAEEYGERRVVQDQRGPHQQCGGGRRIMRK